MELEDGTVDRRNVAVKNPRSVSTVKEKIMGNNGPGGRRRTMDDETDNDE